MTKADIITSRLYNQQLSEPAFITPEQVVSWMGAMQSQEYAMAKWAIALRANNLDESAIEQAFNEGKILRTHLMRPTWHFVSPADIRWLLALTAPRVHAFNAYQYRKNGLDNTVFSKCNAIIIQQLEGGKFLTRNALNEAFVEAGIVTDGVGLSCLMMQAELDGIICSGPRQGKQFTYALLDERVASTRPFTQEEALTELVKRYFTSRGPATMQDFVWWSGLTTKDAAKGVNNLPSDFAKTKIDGQEYIFKPAGTKDLMHPNHSFLMPDYDEYGIAYKNRNAILPSKAPNEEQAVFAYNRMVVINGVIAGSWQRTVKNGIIHIEVVPVYPLTTQENEIIANSIERFKAFLGG